MLNGRDVQLEKRRFDILALATERMLRVFSDKGKGKKSSREASTVEVEEDSLIRETKSFSLHETQNPQQNPNHVASSSSSFPVASKRRVVVPNEPVREIEPVREREAPVRKRKPVRREVVVRERPEETPEWLVNLMREENGFDAKLIFEKELTATDIAKHQNRLLIPINQIVDHDFLNEEELYIIEQHYNGTHVQGVGVSLVDSEGQQWELNLSKWSMKNTVYYVLVSGWNRVVVDKRLQSRQTIRLWSFHTPHGLYFAM